ncbi:hypothetical protein ACFWBB_00720 [Streptomyces sp. NPDC060000]|uniref:hypothetical protein n=1 Tax=Streptomyces sp. NPDC060000 TaxID=3347031 RepID=UPI00368323E4
MKTSSRFAAVPVIAAMALGLVLSAAPQPTEVRAAAPRATHVRTASMDGAALISTGDTPSGNGDTGWGRR